MISVIMLSACHYADSLYQLSVTRLNVSMLSLVMLCVIVLSVSMLSAVMLSVKAPVLTIFMMIVNSGKVVFSKFLTKNFFVTFPLLRSYSQLSFVINQRTR
jgi:hypothetical protein